MGLFSACIFVLCSVFARLDLFPKNSRERSPEELNGKNGTMDPGEKAWPPRLIGGLDSWDPKMKGIVASGKTPMRGPQTTGTQMLHVLIRCWIFQFAMYSCGVSS